MEFVSILKNKILSLESLTFDDVLLLPGFTDFKRQEVDLTTKLHKNIVLKLPIISSPMDTVTEDKMAVSMAKNGGLGIIHRNLTIKNQALIVEKVKKIKVNNQSDSFKNAAVDKNNCLLTGAAVGLGDDFEDRISALIKVKTDLIVIDNAHGYTKFIIEAISYLKKNCPKIPVMAGNIATYQAAKNLISAGADILRVGMGPGSICTTRIVTGVGVPQITAVSEVVRAKFNLNSSVSIVADGGITQIGDIAKTLAFGADCVMLGSLLARFSESPGKIVFYNGKKYKQYRGMGSAAAMKKGTAERYGQLKTQNRKTLIAEGVEALVPYQGNVSDYLSQIEGSLRSAFYYIGAKNLNEFFIKSKCLKISPAALKESHPHSVIIKNFGQNYNL